MDDGAFAGFSEQARRRLPRLFADYIDGGAHGERTMARNRAAFGQWGIVPRGLRDVSSINLATQCFGRSWALPVFLAPLGFAGMFHAHGEQGAAYAAHKRGVGMGVSTFSIAPMEKVAATGADLMAQIYVFRDRALTRDMLERARACGMDGIILTIDTAITPVRERDMRNGFRHLSRPTATQMAGLLRHPSWLYGQVRGGAMPNVGNIAGYTGSRGVMAQARDVVAQIDAGLDWDDLAWLRATWGGTLVVKGIMHPDDAIRAAEIGADGLIISNHGGRQMDPAPATLDVLPAIAQAVGGRVDIMLDSGIRRGGDVVAALALGARAVSIGRPWAWGLAAGGARGVGLVLDTLAREISDVMALAGLPDIAAVRAAGRNALWRF
ncbi:alpha-hydroxy-acid oxidizing protein [Acetobacter sp. TBRC 12305]|uniref:Alpha-hydroxy-acid oxidizing protein n=1 Tax=Acetobacter garciniae TaxID=2817435 RepID=A0A939KPW9_9PROT|nr:alpha-hydroxy acid oxidase [Acetobacter garciniae]MBO1324507.1 alpha-hydroxy-acid oxidizing protein [Acetobacter garciniae]MBX0344196.1 alpha-hydroxy-acid oxidizing protein [Acetobacter garciniae]